MYYISHHSDNLELSAIKKRLSDFKGEEDTLYHVRTNRKIPKRGIFIVRVYRFEDGKLRPTKLNTAFSYREFLEYQGYTWGRESLA